MLATAVFGALLGGAQGFLALALGGMFAAYGDESGVATFILGLSAVAAALMAIVCAVVYFFGSPRLLRGAAFGLTVAVVWHAVSIAALTVRGFQVQLFGWILLGIAAFLAWHGKDTPSRGQPV